MPPSYSQAIRNPKPVFTAEVLVAGSTGEIDLEGGTLAGVLIEADITSTTFTITVARQSGGTFVTVADPKAAGADHTWTIGATSNNYFPISKEITFGFQFCKIVFDQSEAPTVFISKRNFD